MKQTILVMTAVLGMALPSGAVQDTNPTFIPSAGTASVSGVSARGVNIERNGRYMAVDMILGLDALKVSSNRAVVITPSLVNGADTLDLPSVGVYGRRRYYYYLRNGKSMLTGPDELSYKASGRPENVVYNQVVPYQDWMDGAQISLRRREYGCCNTLLGEERSQLGLYAEPEKPAENIAVIPVDVYVTPPAGEPKVRSLEGSAYIDFRVDRTEIDPTYRRNNMELGKIEATIDSVRNDQDVTITGVWLKGYASPESPYAHNRELAIGRTESLRRYIRNLYHFDNRLISTDYEAEDWAGLRKYVEESDLEHRSEILDIIDSNREPDNKEWRIKSVYPEEYKILLRDCYPALRHTDYRISYTVRSYGDIEEIRRVMREHPQNLSLNEFYRLAQTYEPGSPEFTEVFETAVRLYPGDATANLNAATAAISRGDTEAARRYLAKAGDSPEAVYARGALAVRTGDYAEARRYLDEARRLGVEAADETLRRVEAAGH